jgi:hypothetical protein
MQNVSRRESIRESFKETTNNNNNLNVNVKTNPNKTTTVNNYLNSSINEMKVINRDVKYQEQLKILEQLKNQLKKNSSMRKA